jgi:hypothetical protein
VVENVYRHRPALCRVAGEDGWDSLKRQDRTARQASRESEADSRNRYPMDIVLTPWLSIGINLLAYLCPSEREREHEHEGEHVNESECAHEDDCELRGGWTR